MKIQRVSGDILGNLKPDLGGEMATTPREWPNKMKEYRDQAAENACDGIRVLLPLLENGSYDREEELRRIGIALYCLQNIARLLESAGASTEPIIKF